MSTAQSHMGTSTRAARLDLPPHSILHPAFFILHFSLGPLLFYVAWFFVLTFPLGLEFNNAFFTDRGDGYQMIWDVWWVRQALAVLHQNFWWTQMVHCPRGASLLLHSLSPLNGLMSVPLAMVLSPIHTFNVLVVLAFAGSGLTAFWLCWRATRSYWPSLAGGFSFAFCSYRWAHYFGHLPMITSQAVPLFMLGLLCLVLRPRIFTAIMTALTLLLVLLADPYQFLDCVIATGVVLFWWISSATRRGTPIRPHLFALAALAVTAALTSGPVGLAMVREGSKAGISGSHNPDWFSADMLGPWIPDWAWLYGDVTRPVWIANTNSVAEKTVCLGPFVLLAAICALVPTRRRPLLILGSTGLFALLTAAFITLSWGPTWRCWAIPVTTLTPYRALAAVFPSLGLAGCPGRMIVMAQLGVSVLAAAGLSRIGNVQSRPWRAAIIVLFTLGLVIESQPRLLLICPPDDPRWVDALRDAPGKGAVVDLLVGSDSVGLYYQTIHHRPIATGDLSRISADTAAQTANVLDLADRGDYARLARLGFAYIVQGTSAPHLSLPVFYSDQAARIYRLPVDTQ